MPPSPVQQAIEILKPKIEHLIYRQAYVTINKELFALEPSDENKVTVIAMLVVTGKYSMHLNGRRTLYQRAKTIYGEDLVKGLE